MDTDAHILDEIVRNELILSCSSQNLSLCNGRMGLTLFFFHYYRYTKKQIYEDIAGELLDDIFEDINTALPINFQNGLCGIGWGIEYLIQNRFVESTEDILESIDQKIMEKDIRRINDFSFETGIEGIAWYFLLRLQFSNFAKTLDNTYQKELSERCKKNKDKVSDILLYNMQNRHTLKYPFEYILNQILSKDLESKLSWKNGLKLLVV